jgi:hypothetical protein
MYAIVRNDCGMDTNISSPTSCVVQDYTLTPSSTTGRTRTPTCDPVATTIGIAAGTTFEMQVSEMSSLPADTYRLDVTFQDMGSTVATTSFTVR